MSGPLVSDLCWLTVPGSSFLHCEVDEGGGWDQLPTLVPETDGVPARRPPKNQECRELTAVEQTSGPNGGDGVCQWGVTALYWA